MPNDLAPESQAMKHEPYWVTEDRPLSAEEMARRLLMMADDLRDIPKVGEVNLFGEVFTEQTARNQIKLRIERLADMASAFCRQLDET